MAYYLDYVTGEKKSQPSETTTPEPLSELNSHFAYNLEYDAQAWTAWLQIDHRINQVPIPDEHWDAALAHTLIKKMLPPATE